MMVSSTSGDTLRHDSPREAQPDADSAPEFYSQYDLKNILGK